LTNSPRLSRKLLSSSPTNEFRARLSFLSSPGLNVSGSYTRNASLISGANAGSVAIVMPVIGTIDFQVMDEHHLCGPWTPFILDPDEAFHATLSEDNHLLIVQLTDLSGCRYREILQHDQTRLVEILTTFLYETPFFRSHRHAQRRLQVLSERLYTFIEAGGDSSSLKLPVRKKVGDDRRLCKALKLLNETLDTDIRIEDIANRCGMSLRTFHYLMKQYIGQSPYQYVRGRRLIRAREAIIRDYPDKVNIAQQALTWGFQHAGRFANYYHQHFGQYPSETLGELDHLRQYADSIRAAGTAGTATRQYWFTSSVPTEEISVDTGRGADDRSADPDASLDDADRVS
jgi:AraC-like DNA-binding protein